MELTAKQKKSQELLQKIITKAWEDKSFKEELIAKPIEAIEELTGEKINLPEININNAIIMPVIVSITGVALINTDIIFLPISFNSSR